LNKTKTKAFEEHMKNTLQWETTQDESLGARINS